MTCTHPMPEHSAFSSKSIPESQILMQPLRCPGYSHIISLLGKAAKPSFGKQGRSNRSPLCCRGVPADPHTPCAMTQVQHRHQGCCHPQLLPELTQRLTPDLAWIGVHDLEVNCSISHIQSPTEFIFWCGRSKTAVRRKIYQRLSTLTQIQLTFMFTLNKHTPSYCSAITLKWTIIRFPY